MAQSDPGHNTEKKNSMMLYCSKSINQRTNPKLKPHQNLKTKYFSKNFKKLHLQKIQETTKTHIKSQTIYSIHHKLLDLFMIVRRNTKCLRVDYSLSLYGWRDYVVWFIEVWAAPPTLLLLLILSIPMTNRNRQTLLEDTRTIPPSWLRTSGPTKKPATSWEDTSLPACCW